MSEENAQLTTWLQAAGTGDQAAFRKLSQALGPRMHALAVRLLSGDHSTAQDVLQEALIKLWQTAPRWQPGGSVAGYVSRLIYTTAMDQHRKKGPVSYASDLARTDEDGEETGLPEHAVPEGLTESIQRRQQREWLLSSIQQLPERQQQAVVLSYFHDHRQQDVAVALGTTEKAVESLLVRARRTLATLVTPTASQHLAQGGYMQ